MFFNKSFATSYVTTINSTIYYPSENQIKITPISSGIILLHEIVHINDSKKITKPLFIFLYLFPQILAPLFLLLLLISCKIFLFLFLLFILPIPAYFRMQFEKRAYLSSLYSSYVLGKTLNFSPILDKQKNNFISQFTGFSYYFMWPFSSYIKNEFDQAINKINAGQRPYEDPIFDIIDDLIDTAKN